MSEKQQGFQLSGLQLRVAALTSWSVHDGFQLGRNATRIRPARVEFDGHPVACDKGQPHQGWLIEHEERGVKHQYFAANSLVDGVVFKALVEK